jgi:hypothetical protein
MNEQLTIIQEDGLKELGELALNDENKAAILEAGGINLILSAMKTELQICK